VLKKINAQKTTSQTLTLNHDDINKTVTVKMQSSSVVTNFNIDKEKGRVSFDVEGNKQNAKGMTEISIGSVLKGPFAIKIDGREKPFTVIEDRTTNETLISLSYDQNARHSISIYGARIAS
jgi:hypothetical protein